LSNWLDPLNSDQREAAEHALGPMLVLAGAGTGKTSVIAARYQVLTQMRGIPPDRLLVLTFTEKATGEMLDRIEADAPVLAGERWVCTYHAFALRVLRAEGWHAGMSMGFRIVTPVEEWELMRDVLFELQPPSLFVVQRPHEMLRPLLKLIERAKQELVSPEAFERYAAELEPDDDGTRERLRQAAAVYRAYQRRLLGRDLLDFDDTIYYLVQLFEQRPHVLARYQERFQHLMIDEFQDTNFAQSRLVEELAARHRNLVVVGDDDQSIYKFRGASLANLERFRRLFPEARLVRLEQNYRSTHPILRAANALIAANPGRMEKTLRTDRVGGQPVTVLEATGSGAEVEGVADLIQEAVSSGRRRPQDIAVLVRANAHIGAFARALQRRGLPYQISGGRGFYLQPEVKDVQAYLLALADPDQPQPLVRLLTLPRYRVDPVQVIRWQREAVESGISLFSLLRARVRAEEFPEVARLLRDLEVLVGQALRLDIQDLFFELMDRTQYLDVLTHREPIERQQISANVQKFAEIIGDFCDTHVDHRLTAFLDYLGLAEQAQADEEVAPLEATLDAVQLMTVHQAKGLEFPVVHVVHFVEGRFPQPRRGEPLALPDALIQEELPQEGTQLSEERRLAYVAATRARDELYFSLATRYEGAKDWRPSSFLREIELGVEDFDFREPVLRRLRAPEVGTGAFEAGPDPARPQAQLELQLEGAPAHLALSYTQIDCYQRCPQMYEYRFVYRLPTRQSAQAQFGRILHRAIQTVSLNAEAGVAVAWEAVEDAYRSAWESERFPAPRQEPGLRATGEAYLRRLWEQGEMKKPLLVEQPFSLAIAGVRVKGRIDRVDRLDDGTYELVDYKSGAPRASRELTSDLQLGLYALAAREVFRFDPLRLAYYYLESGERVVVEKSSERLAQDRDTITQVAASIAARDFRPRPERFKCAGCDFRLLCPSAL
jgi:DNA helicase-2/ATP-dependent DNA helicase PcrA